MKNFFENFFGKTLCQGESIGAITLTPCRPWSPHPTDSDGGNIDIGMSVGVLADSVSYYVDCETRLGVFRFLYRPIDFFSIHTQFTIFVV